MKLGIIGLPNVGKSTLFNALTGGGAESANYPFCTIDPNVGIVPVPDPRLDVLAKMYDPELYTPATIEFVDIAGSSREPPTERVWETSSSLTSETRTRSFTSCAVLTTTI